MATALAVIIGTLAGLAAYRATRQIGWRLFIATQRHRGNHDAVDWATRRMKDL